MKFIHHSRTSPIPKFSLKYTIESNLKIRTINDPNITRMHLNNDKINKKVQMDKGGCYLSSKTICCPISNDLYENNVFAKPTSRIDDDINMAQLLTYLKCTTCMDKRQVPCDCDEGKRPCPNCGGDRQDIMQEDIGIQGDMETGGQGPVDAENADGFIDGGMNNVEYGGDGALVNCNICFGIGEVDCETCGGNKMRNCPACNPTVGGPGTAPKKGTSKITSHIKNALFVKTDVYVSPIELPLRDLIKGRDSKCVQQIWRYSSNVEDDDDTDESIFHTRSKYFKRVVREKIWSNICSKHRRYGRRHDLFKECTYLDVFPIFIVKYTYQGVKTTHVVVA